MKNHLLSGAAALAIAAVWLLASVPRSLRPPPGKRQASGAVPIAVRAATDAGLIAGGRESLALMLPTRPGYSNTVSCSMSHFGAHAAGCIRR